MIKSSPDRLKVKTLEPTKMHTIDDATNSQPVILKMLTLILRDLFVSIIIRFGVIPLGFKDWQPLHNCQSFFCYAKSKANNPLFVLRVKKRSFLI